MTSAHSFGSRARSSMSSEVLEAGGDVKQAMQDAAGRAKDSVSEAMSEAKDTAANALQDQKAMASDRLDSVAGAIRLTANNLHEHEETAMGNWANQAAERVELASGYLRSHDVRDLLRDAQDLARRHPAIFLGGAFVAGAMLGRFLRASQRHGRSSTSSPSLGGDSFRNGSASEAVHDRTVDRIDHGDESLDAYQRDDSSRQSGTSLPISGGWAGGASSPGVSGSSAESANGGTLRSQEAQ